MVLQEEGSPRWQAFHEKICPCSHRDMQKWGVYYWDTYSPLVNCMFVRAIITLIILRDIHNKSVVFLS